MNNRRVSSDFPASPYTNDNNNNNPHYMPPINNSNPQNQLLQQGVYQQQPYLISQEQQYVNLRLLQQQQQQQRMMIPQEQPQLAPMRAPNYSNNNEYSNQNQFTMVDVSVRLPPTPAQHHRRSSATTRIEQQHINNTVPPNTTDLATVTNPNTIGTVLNSARAIAAANNYTSSVGTAAGVGVTYNNNNNNASINTYQHSPRTPAGPPLPTAVGPDGPRPTSGARLAALSSTQAGPLAGPPTNITRTSSANKTAAAAVTTPTNPNNQFNNLINIQQQQQQQQSPHRPSTSPQPPQSPNTNAGTNPRPSPCQHRVGPESAIVNCTTNNYATTTTGNTLNRNNNVNNTIPQQLAQTTTQAVEPPAHNAAQPAPAAAAGNPSPPQASPTANNINNNTNNNDNNAATAAAASRANANFSITPSPVEDEIPPGFEAIISRESYSTNTTPDDATPSPLPPNQARANGGRNTTEPEDSGASDPTAPPSRNTNSSACSGLSNNSNRVVSKYFLCDSLGKGAFGRVWRITRRSDGMHFVAKLVELSRLDGGAALRARSEVSCLSACKHFACVGFVEDFNVNDNLLIIMEYCDAGDLNYQLKTMRQLNNNHATGFKEREARLILLQLALALNHLHRRKMLHRDIKAGNVLLSTTGLVKIGDFGLSKEFATTVDHNNAETFCGTADYLPPEIWRKQRYGAKADVWSLGVLMFECIVGRRPFRGDNLRDKIINTSAELPAHITISDGLRNLLAGMLHKNPADRISVRSILDYPYIKNDTLQALINMAGKANRFTPEMRDFIMEGIQDAYGAQSPYPTIPNCHFEGPVQKNKDGHFVNRYLVLRDGFLGIFRNQVASQGQVLNSSNAVDVSLLERVARVHVTPGSNLVTNLFMIDFGGDNGTTTPADGNNGNGAEQTNRGANCVWLRSDRCDEWVAHLLRAMPRLNDAPRQ